jgi:hypothetical protein
MTGMTKNSHFLEQVSAMFARDAEIIIVRLPLILNILCYSFGLLSLILFIFRESLVKLQGCQSGRRSLMAAAELCSAVSAQSPSYISWSLLPHRLLSLWWLFDWFLLFVHPFSGFHCSDRHRRRVLCLEGERATGQPVTSATRRLF